MISPATRGGYTDLQTVNFPKGVKAMADNPYKVKNQGPQEVKGSPSGSKGKTVSHKGGDLRG